MNEIVEWLGKEEIQKIYSSSYWNDIGEEKKKEWWVKNPSDPRLMEYLKSTGLLEELELAIERLAAAGLLKGNVLDLAAGACWTSAVMSRIETVESVDAVDISYHRLQEIAPLVFEIFKAETAKIRRIIGSFYDIKSEKEHYDVIILSQAFHHADDPMLLISQCDRVLKRGGCMVLIGEQPVSKIAYIKRVIKNILLKFRLTLNFRELFPPDDKLGDHYYRLDDYRRMFGSIGCRLEHFRSNIKNSFIFIVSKI